jgi:hypothetical protein
MKTLSGYLNKFYVIVALLSMIAFIPGKAQAEQPLKNIKVTGTVKDGSALEGTLTITSMAFNQGQLVGNGVLHGKVNGKPVKQNFENIPLRLSHNNHNGVAAQQQIAQATNVCDILFLDIGPINLDLLGLVVNLSEITLNIDAVSGPGNLLGNLLCAVAGLLDNFNLDAILQGIIQSLLNSINQLL